MTHPNQGFYELTVMPSHNSINRAKLISSPPNLAKEPLYLTIGLRMFYSCNNMLYTVFSKKLLEFVFSFISIP
jgi:hypothetical protein